MTATERCINSLYLLGGSTVYGEGFSSLTIVLSLSSSIHLMLFLFTSFPRVAVTAICIVDYVEDSCCCFTEIQFAVCHKTLYRPLSSTDIWFCWCRRCLPSATCIMPRSSSSSSTSNIMTKFVAETLS